MAFDTSTLVNLTSAPPGSNVYYHDAGSDSMATVLTAGYFNNSDDNQNLVADDIIFSQCTDGDIWHKVSAVSSGSVTTQVVSGEGPWHGDKSTASQAFIVGISELGTGTATAFSTPVPYIGAKLTVFQSGTATVKTVGVSSSGVTFDDPGNTTITLTGSAGANITLLGVSTSRWAVIGGSGFTLS